MLLSWAISFGIFAMIAGLLGFSHAAASTALIAKTCFALFVVLGLGRVMSESDQRITRATHLGVRVSLRRARAATGIDFESA